MARARETHDSAYARKQHRALSLDAKLALGKRVTIYDAAKAYRVEAGTPDRPIRDLLRDVQFRTTWQEFKGKGNMWRQRVEWGKRLGWDMQRVREVLNSISP